MQPPSEVRLSAVGGATVLEIVGDVSAASNDSIRAAYQEAACGGTGRMVLRFEPSAYINSGGIAVLIQVLAQAKRSQHQVAIAGLSDHFKKIFGMVGITKIASVHDTAEEAAAAFS